MTQPNQELPSPGQPQRPKAAPAEKDRSPSRFAGLILLLLTALLSLVFYARGEGGLVQLITRALFGDSTYTLTK